MNRLTRIAVLVPLLGLVALIGRAEFARRAGPVWRVRITGYDPRDLLHGHYLSYRYAFEWHDLDRCGSMNDTALSRAPESGCCLCFEGPGPVPLVHEVSCDETAACAAWLRSDAVEGPQRYFVPEERALELEAALRNRDAALEMTCGPNGVPAIRELLLDGRPWRDFAFE